MDNVAIFVDVQNVYYTTRQAHQCSFDYNRFWAKATAERTVSKAIAYSTDRGDEKQKQFQNILRAIGFEVKLKPYIQRVDGSAKADWDVGITLDVIDYAKGVDVVVLVSGDGDFGLLVDKIQSDHNVRVEVYGVPQLTARSLIQSSTTFFPIEDDLLLSKK